jgi:AbiV family abortive infection protein
MVNLEIEELKNGLLKCFNNSKSLLSDADYLFKDNRFARAFAIYVLCIEEIQKVDVLFKLFLEKEASKQFTKEEKDNYNKFFSSHIFKIRSSAIKDLFIHVLFEKYKLKLYKTKKQINNQITNPKQIDTFKQHGLYTHLINKKKFKEPSELISIEKCRNIQEEARWKISLLVIHLDKNFI